MVAVVTTEARVMAVEAVVAAWVLPIMDEVIAGAASTGMAALTPVAELPRHRTAVTTAIVLPDPMPVEEEVSIRRTESTTAIALPGLMQAEEEVSIRRTEPITANALPGLMQAEEEVSIRKTEPITANALSALITTDTTGVGEITMISRVLYARGRAGNLPIPMAVTAIGTIIRAARQKGSGNRPADSQDQQIALPAAGNNHNNAISQGLMAAIAAMVAIEYSHQVVVRNHRAEVLALVAVVIAVDSPPVPAVATVAAQDPPSAPEIMVVAIHQAVAVAAVELEGRDSIIL